MVSAYLKVSDELTLHYERSGDGELGVIFIPGWTMTTRVFERQLAHLDGSERCTAITYDPRGQGLSTKTADGHTYERHGRDLHNFVEKLGLDRVVLIGWSNGGFDALSYLHQFGSAKLASLMMLDAAPKGKGTDLLTTSGWWPDYSQDLKALNDRVPLIYVVREEWTDLATSWAAANTPAAEVVSFGKHMMFWERHEQFNEVLDRFLENVK